MVGRRRADGWRRRRGFCLAVVAAVAGAAFGLTGTSNAAVTSVQGSAYGYYLNVSLFTAPQPPVGPVPTVTLPPGGSVPPITATAPSGSAAAGPARFFSSGPITLSTQGTTGASGSVTTSASITNVNESGQEAFGYPPGDPSGLRTSISSACSASESARTGSTTISNGILVTDSGDDDPTNTIPDHAPVTVILPTMPAPNQEFLGHLHVNGTTDNFRYVFNEQVVSGNRITVNAAHEYILGPTAVGDLIIGQSICGVTGTGIVTTTTRPTTTTTRPSTTTTTLVPPGVNCGDLAATIVGTPGPDRLTGTDGPDVIAGLGGDDKIFGLDGDDVVCGGGGNDTIELGAGNDTASGGDGDDRLVGDSGRDLLRGGDGNDDLVGGSGNDALNGGSGTDDCNGGSGINTYANCATITPAPVPGSPTQTSPFSSAPTLRAPQV